MTLSHNLMHLTKKLRGTGRGEFGQKLPYKKVILLAQILLKPFLRAEDVH
jgi:hypothetical protein